MKKKPSKQKSKASVKVRDLKSGRNPKGGGKAANKNSEATRKLL